MPPNVANRSLGFRSGDPDDTELIRQLQAWEEAAPSLVWGSLVAIRLGV